MATTSKGLPIYANGDVAGFLTAGGWNAAMEAIDTAIEGGGEAGIDYDQQFIYVMTVAANSTSASITVPVGVSSIKKVMAFTADGTVIPADGITTEANSTQATKTDVEVTLKTAPSSDLSINITVIKGV